MIRCAMRILSVLKVSGIRAAAALLGVLSTTDASAAAVAVDRELMQQQMQALAQQIAIAQQQIDQSPNARVQLGAALQQLQAAQTQIGELLRQISSAPPAPQLAPQYSPPAPQLAPQYPQPAPQYPQPTPQPAPQPAPQLAPQYPPPAPQYPPPAPQFQPPAPTAPPPPQAPSSINQNAISEDNFRSLLQQLTGAAASDRLNLLRQLVVGNSFLVEQIARILPLYAYTTDRVAALQVLVPQIIDRQNGYKLLALFRYSDDRENAQKILNGIPPSSARE